MGTTFPKTAFLSGALALILLTTARPASAQTDGYRNARRLGGTTSFNRTPLTTRTA